MHNVHITSKRIIGDQSNAVSANHHLITQIKDRHKVLLDFGMMGLAPGNRVPLDHKIAKTLSQKSKYVNRFK